MSYIVKVGVEPTHGRYFVISSEIPGLNIEADTFEEFVAVAEDVAPDLVGQPGREIRIRFEREIVLAA